MPYHQVFFLLCSSKRSKLTHLTQRFIGDFLTMETGGKSKQVVSDPQTQVMQ